MSYRLGVDVGGTFTDLLLIEEATGARPSRAKVPSTAAMIQSVGVLERRSSRICEAGGGAALRPPSADVMHGTTVATNAVLHLHRRARSG